MSGQAACVHWGAPASLGSQVLLPTQPFWVGCSTASLLLGTSWNSLDWSSLWKCQWAPAWCPVGLRLSPALEPFSLPGLENLRSPCRKKIKATFLWAEDLEHILQKAWLECQPRKRKIEKLKKTFELVAELVFFLKNDF